MSKSTGKGASGNRERRPGGGKRDKKQPRSEAKAGPADPLGGSRDLDLRTLVLLSMGSWSELADLEWPSENIRRWVEKATIRQVRGLLLVTLHRWHELRQPKN